MSIYKNNFLIINSLGNTKLHFYILDSCLYCCLEDHNRSAQKKKLVEKADSFDLTLDDTNIIHLVCLTKDGNLYYLTYSKENWTRTVLKKFSPRSNNMDFIKIMSTGKIIHIFYNFNNTLKTATVYPNKSYFIHLYKYGSKWKYRYLNSISQNKKEIKYFIQQDTNNNLFYFFSSVNKSNSFKLYYSTFSHSIMNWKPNIKIDLDTKAIKLINTFIDSKGNIHFLYKNSDDMRCIYHTCRLIDNLLQNTSVKSRINCEELENTNYKIFELNGKIYIVWKDSDILYLKTSTDQGITWTEKDCKELNDLYDITLVSKEYNNINSIKIINTFGKINENEQYILGLNNLTFSGFQEHKSTELSSELSETKLEDISYKEIHQDSWENLPYQKDDSQAELENHVGYDHGENKQNTEVKSEVKLNDYNDKNISLDEKPSDFVGNKKENKPFFEKIVEFLTKK